MAILRYLFALVKSPAAWGGAIEKALHSMLIRNSRHVIVSLGLLERSTSPISIGYSPPP